MQSYTELNDIGYVPMTRVYVWGQKRARACAGACMVRGGMHVVLSGCYQMQTLVTAASSSRQR